MKTDPLLNEAVQEPTSAWALPVLKLKKKKKSCCEKYKRKGKRCGSCPLTGCA